MAEAKCTEQPAMVDNPPSRLSPAEFEVYNHMAEQMEYFVSRRSKSSAPGSTVDSYSTITSGKHGI